MGEGRKKFFCAIVFAVALILISSRARAEGSRPPQTPAKFQMGMEFELQAKFVENLVHLFDWDRVEVDQRVEAARPGGEPVWWEGRLADQPKAFLAHMAIELAPEREPMVPNYPPVRKDLSREDAAMLGELRWHYDSGKLEFSHRVPFSDPQAYLRSLRRFAKVAGIEAKLDRPNDPSLPELSYHVHLSRTDRASVEEPLFAYNHLMLARLARADAAGELFAGHRVSIYSEELKDRGVVRLFEEDHFELRRHVLTPEQELAEMQLLFSMPAEKATQKMVALTKVALTPMTVAELVELSPADAFSIVSRAYPELLLQPGFARAVAERTMEEKDHPHERTAALVERLYDFREREPHAEKIFADALKREIESRIASKTPHFLGKASFQRLARLVEVDSPSMRFSAATSLASISVPFRSGGPSSLDLGYVRETAATCVRTQGGAKRAALGLRSRDPRDAAVWIESLPAKFLASELGFPALVTAVNAAGFDTRLRLLGIIEANPGLFTSAQQAVLYAKLSYDSDVRVRTKTDQILHPPPWTTGGNCDFSPLGGTQ